MSVLRAVFFALLSPAVLAQALGLQGPWVCGQLYVSTTRLGGDGKLAYEERGFLPVGWSREFSLFPVSEYDLRMTPSDIGVNNMVLGMQDFAFEAITSIPVFADAWSANLPPVPETIPTGLDAMAAAIDGRGL